jgi:hypothetical protein
MARGRHNQKNNWGPYFSADWGPNYKIWGTRQKKKSGLRLPLSPMWASPCSLMARKTISFAKHNIYNCYIGKLHVGLLGMVEDTTTHFLPIVSHGVDHVDAMLMQPTATWVWWCYSTLAI